MSSQPATPWSYTRRRTARECERKFYWAYVGTRRGAYAPADSMTRLAWALKQTTALPLLAGTAVHTAARLVATAIRDGAPVPTYAELRAGAALTMNTGYVNTVRRLERWWTAPGAFPVFREAITRGELDPDALTSTRGRLERALSHLCVTPLLDDLRRCGPGEIVLSDAIERALVTEEPGPGDDGATGQGIRAAGAPMDGGDIEVLGALDLVYLHHDPATVDGLVEQATWCVTDFKTGPTPLADLRLQLGGYGVLLRAMGYPTTQGCYLGRVVCLGDGSELLERITEGDMRAALATIDADAALFRRLVAHAAGTSAPADVAADTYPIAERPPRSCPGCEYLPLCTASLGRRPWTQPRPDVAPAAATAPVFEGGSAR